MEKSHQTIIGYFAATKAGDVACDGPACLVAGSYKTMKSYLAQSKTKPLGKLKIIKTRFSEIMDGMSRGGAYAFDEESYGEFAPLAREAGMACEDVDFKPDADGEIKFYTIFPV